MKWIIAGKDCIFAPKTGTTRNVAIRRAGLIYETDTIEVLNYRGTVECRLFMVKALHGRFHGSKGRDEICLLSVEEVER